MSVSAICPSSSVSNFSVKLAFCVCVFIVEMCEMYTKVRDDSSKHHVHTRTQLQRHQSSSPALKSQGTILGPPPLEVTESVCFLSRLERDKPNIL